MADKPTTRVRAKNGQFASTRKSRKRRCADCRTTKSTQWRTGDDKRTLCNACGIRIAREVRRINGEPSTSRARRSSSPESDQSGRSGGPTNSLLSSPSTLPRTRLASTLQGSPGSSSTQNRHSSPILRRSQRQRTSSSNNPSTGSSRPQMRSASGGKGSSNTRDNPSAGSGRDPMSSSCLNGSAVRDRFDTTNLNSPQRSTSTTTERVNDAQATGIVTQLRTPNLQPLPSFSSLLNGPQNRNYSRGRCSLENLLNPQ